MSAVELTCDCTSPKSTRGGASGALDFAQSRASEKSGLLVSLPIARNSAWEQSASDNHVAVNGL